MGDPRIGRIAARQAAQTAATRLTVTPLMADTAAMSDEQVGKLTALFDVFDPDSHAYSVGDVASYDGALYRAVQAHKSQADWTPDKMRRAADALVARYENPSSAAMALKHLRAGLMAIGLTYEQLKDASRPDIIAAHNAKIQQRTGQRIAEGIVVPPPYERLADLRQRVAAFVAGGPISAQTASVTSLRKRRRFSSEPP